MNIKLFGLVSLITFIIIILLSICKQENFTDGKKELPSLKRPFVHIYDNNGNKLNVILISKPFGSEEEFKPYHEHKDSNIFIGVSSYLEFPNIPTNPLDNWKDRWDQYKYKEICQGWMHGFKDPENYFPPDVPIILSSESDWIDCNISKPDNTIKKDFDFIYICLKVDEKKTLCDDWATFNKNWSLAKKCLDVFCNKYKLKGLLVGRKGCELPNGCSYMSDVSTNMLSHSELQKSYNKAKFIFIPNEKDASPRVLTEALASDIPCLINKNILGGWKYINEQTGEEFIDENDVGEAVEKILEGIKQKQYKPRDYFIKNYSIENSGKKLKDFLYKNWGSEINIPIDKVDFLSPDHNKQDFKPCKSSIL